MAVVVSAGLGVWPASFVVSAETSSLRLSSKTQGISWLASGVVDIAFGIGLPFVYNADAGNLGAKTGFVIFATAVIGYILTFFFVPELKGKSAVEIDRLFERKTPTRQFRTADGWQPLETPDSSVRLTNVLSNMSKDAPSDDGESGQTINVEPTQPADAFEPLRKRPTF